MSSLDIVDCAGAYRVRPGPSIAPEAKPSEPVRKQDATSPHT